MLSMKTLRVAIVTMGSALLLGPMLAQAERINLSGGTAVGLGPLTYAIETVDTPANSTTGRFELDLQEAFQIAVKPRRAINATEEVYLRIDLTGARFGAAPTLIQGAQIGTAPALNIEDLDEALASDPSSGGVGMSFAVLKLGSPTEGASVSAANMIAVVIPINGANGDLQLESPSGNVSASITAYTNPDDALDQVNGRSTFGGSGNIIRMVSGLTVTIDAADAGVDVANANNAVASVAHGFLWFVGPTGQAKLGWLGVQEKVLDQASVTRDSVRDANGGEALVANGVLPTAGQIEFRIAGNMDIGAFQLIPDPSYDAMESGAAKSTTDCRPAVEGQVDRGDLKGADGMPLISKEGEQPSGLDGATTGNLAANTDAIPARLLCVNVDVMGPETNASPIQEGDYSATAYTKATAAADAVMVGQGDLASISHNGASVQIPYLTTSEKHNQRLIIVNRGTRDATITSLRFTTEDGTEVELTDTVQAAMDAGLLKIPGGETWVASMNQTLNITGDSRRVSASIAFAATSGHLSVATTQVNLSDGSTDTVVYDVK